MKWDTKIGLALCLILVLLATAGCSRDYGAIMDDSNATATASREEKSAADASRSESGVPNFQGIADALGCVFAPDSCQN
jgi:hypothetical protein